jgi:hypothetical protein
MQPCLTRNGGGHSFLADENRPYCRAGGVLRRVGRESHRHLALAVKSTRFGCADQKTGTLSKAAFDLLHSLYPKSSWTDKTKYWFKM